MCGIFGLVVCHHANCTRRTRTQHRTERDDEPPRADDDGLAIVQRALDGLARLEYRGYDSAGVSVMHDTRTSAHMWAGRCAGSLQALRDAVRADFRPMTDEVEYRVLNAALCSRDSDAATTTTAIAHTRWATHGPACVRNAHPHTHSGGAVGAFSVVHNGIVTNYDTLRTVLAAAPHRYAFASDTDSEVLAVLCHYEASIMHAGGDDETLDEVSLARVVCAALRHVEGTYAVLVQWSRRPGEVVAASHGSPLVVGRYTPPRPSSPRGEDGDEHSGDDGEQAPWCASLGVRCASGVGAFDARDAASPAAHAHGGRGVSYALASDAAALAGVAAHVVHLEDGDVVHVRAGASLRLYTMRDDVVGDGDGATRRATPLDVAADDVDKGGYADYMLKEICEQPRTLEQTLGGRLCALDGARADDPVQLGGVAAHLDAIAASRRLVFVACGTSYHAALATRALFERCARLPVDVEVASDFLDRAPPVTRADACVFVSQSGETADTLAALRYCAARGALCVGVVNRVGSAIARACACGVHLNCGVEVGVASTKAYTSQLAVLALLAAKLGAPHRVAAADVRGVARAAAAVPALVRAVLGAQRAPMRALAAALCDVPDTAAAAPAPMLLIGRGAAYATCCEAALKIKEIAYVHAAAVAAGELKHGPLALVDADAVIVFVCTSGGRAAVRNAVEQVVARGGAPAFVAYDDDASLRDWVRAHVPRARAYVTVPRASHAALQPLVDIVPLQLLAYEMAKVRGTNVDRPRNLAKSVTVG